MCMCASIYFVSGESLPESFRTCLLQDRSRADLVIVMGSSLKVQPVAGMLHLFPASTPMVLINREVVGQPDEFDVEVLGLADEVCSYLTQRLGWTLPEVDKQRDTFAALSASPAAVSLDGEMKMNSDSLAAAAASSSSNVLAPPPPSSFAAASAAAAASTFNVTVSSPVSGRSLSPTFVAPNRYLFSACSHSPLPPSDSPSPESASLQSPPMRELTEEGRLIIDEGVMITIPTAHETAVAIAEAADAAVQEQAAPEPAETKVEESNGVNHSHINAAAPPFTSPPLTPLKSPSSSPKLRSARPPPLHVGGSSAEHKPGSDLMCDLNLTCTPTRSSRFILSASHGGASTASSSATTLLQQQQSPLMKPLLTPSGTLKRKAELHHTTNDNTERKVGEHESLHHSAPSDVHVLIDPVPLDAASKLSAHSAAASVASISANMDNGGMHLPEVKRRKVSTEESKRE